MSSRKINWDGPTGYVTQELIREQVGDEIAGTSVYVCGPPPMRKSVLAALRALGVLWAHVHYEAFSL